MRLKQIEAFNFRQHRDFKREFTGNLIGLIGPNGSGKSNFINMINYMLTGAVPDTTKDRLLSWGAADDGYVKGIVEDGGRDIEIFRALASSSATLTADNEVTKGITKVNNAVIDLIGVDSTIADAIFARQGQIDAVLFAPPAERELAFQKLCGVGDALKIHKDLGKILNQEIAEVKDYSAELVELEDGKAAIHKALDEVVHELEATVIPQGREQELKDSLQVIADYRSALEAYKRLSEEVDSTTAKISELKERIENVRGEDMPDMDNIRTEIERLRAIQSCLRMMANLARLDRAIEQEKAKLSGYEGDEAANERLETLTKQAAEALALSGKVERKNAVREQLAESKTMLDNLEAPAISEDDLERAEQYAANLDKEKERALAKIELFGALKDAAAKNESPECLMCGSVVDSADKITSRMADFVQQYQEAFDKAKRDGEEFVQSYKQAKEQRRLYLEKAGRLKDTVERLTEELEGLKDVPDQSPDVAGLNDKIAEIRVTMREMKSAKEALSSRQAEYDAAHSELNAAFSKQWLTDSSDELKNADSDKIAKSISSFEKTLEEAKNAESRAKEIKAQLNSMEAICEVRKEDLAKADATVKELGEKMGEEARLSVLTTQRELEGELERLKQAERAASRLTGRKDELQRSKREQEAKINDVIAKRDSQKDYEAVIKKLTDVRDWFHYGNGPRELSQLVLSQMVQTVNQYLKLFGAPFVVAADDESLTLKVIFLDGREMPSSGYTVAEDLSGGQRMTLAIAFHFARYDMFTAKIGLLVMDEPTAYLDDETIDRLCVVLEKVKELAQKAGLQIIVSTHEKRIIPILDTYIDFTPAEQGQ